MKQKVFVSLILLIFSTILFVFNTNAENEHYTQWKLPDGAKARLGKGEINDITCTQDGALLAVASSIGIWISVTDKARNTIYNDFTEITCFEVIEAQAAPTVQVTLPEKNALLPNYPNPFNPETWIPYQLSAPADVSITIYGSNGGLIRTLNIGHKTAGTYHHRNNAAHWDGKNAQGEPVASGIFFYTLTAGDWTATRKMLIRK